MAESRARQFAKLAKEVDSDGAVKADGVASLNLTTLTGLIDSDYVVDRAAARIIQYNTILGDD